MKSKLGIQTQWDSGEALRYNREVQPVAVMGINVTKADWWSQLALDNPGVKRIYRHHPNSDELGLIKWMDNPVYAADDLVAFLQGHLSNALNHIDLLAGDNEFILGPDHEPPDRIDKADRFMAAFVQCAELYLGKGVCVGNFNVGHWGPETVNYFPRTLAAIQAQAIRGNILSYFCFHEYNWPLLRDDTHWYTGKFLRAMPPILEQYPDVLCMITEIGIDKASRISGGHAGFRKTHDDVNVAIEGYCGDHGLAWCNDLLNQIDYIAAALIFGCGMGDWRAMGFDIMNNVDDVAILNHIKQFPVVVPPEPPPPEPPPNGGDNMIRVFDLDGNELSEEAGLDRIAFHGITIYQPQNMRPGEWYWAVVKMRESIGPACFIYTGLLEDGSPAYGQQAAWAWADDMGDADDILSDNYPTDWQLQADLGVLNENGNMGPAYGQHGWFHAPYEAGPGRAWIRDSLRWSVHLRGMGMLDMTNHHTMFATWQLKQWESEEPPTPSDDDTLKLIQVDVAEIRKILEKGYTPPEPPVPELEVFYAEYFPNMDLSGEPVLTRDESTIDHFWGSGSPGIPVPADYFSARWTGVFTFEEGTYEFIVLVDDGFRLWIDELMRLETWKAQSPTEYRTTVTLPAGKHAIRAEYYEQAGGATCRLTWKKL